MDNKKEKTLREHLSAAGKVKSEKKAKASRDNGKKGGRPKIKLFLGSDGKLEIS